MGKVSRFVSTVASVGLLCVACLACGKGAGGSDSAARVDKTMVAVAYDGARARILCDKYGSGMLSKDDYAEMIAMVKVSYGRLALMADSLLEAAKDTEAFYESSSELQDSWRSRFPHAEFLGRIMAEADSAQMGPENFKNWKALDAEMGAKIKALDEKRIKRFGDYR